MKGTSVAPEEQSPISWIRLFRWARQALAGLFGPFFLITFIGLASAWMVQYNLQIVTNLIGSAGAGGGAAAEAPATQPDAAESGEAGAAATGKAAGDGGGFSFIEAIVPDDIVPSAILLAVTGVLVIALAFGNRVGTVWLNTLMLRKLQLRVHDKLLRLGPSYHRQHDMGEKQTIVTMYSQNAQPMLRDVLAFPIVRLGSLASALLLLFHNLNKLRTEGQGSMVYAVLAVLLIVLPIGGWYLSGRLRKASRVVRDKQAMISSTLVDSLTAPQEVQIMDAGGRRSATFAAKLKELAMAQVQAALRNEMSVQFQAAVPELLRIGLVLWAVFVFGRDNPGAAVQSIVGIYFFVPLVVQPIQEIIQFYSMLNASWPNIEKVGLTLEESEQVKDTGKKTVADIESFDVVVKDVTFAPQPDLTVLENLDFSFPKDKITALVGEAGSGKSTILQMVARLFDPNEGQVLLGGTDIKELKLSSLRSVIGTVSQFPLFIEADVRQNLRLAEPDATDAQMEAACRTADVWPTLEKLAPSDPLSVHVPRVAGAGLSGGERRRLAIARAILTDPKILLLDEPSTGIDALSVRKIADELRKTSEGRTVLLVDHDMDLVEALADVVCCLEGGRISDVGTPKELTSRPSLFGRLLAARRTYGGGKDEIEIDGTVPVRRVDVSQAGKEGAAKAGAAKAGAAKGGEAPPQPPGEGPSPDRPLKAGKGMAQLVED